LKAVAAAINSNTIMLVGSAPEYAHGIVDDIPALGKLALKHNLGLHVDGCLGGFLLPYLRDLGHDIPVTALFFLLMWFCFCFTIVKLAI
jgi:sphinganine-1-phosphate aldolase